ncbi:MAG: hypothetical protein A2Z45_06305 [Chloroflexi bacterium RBG_19FT_COMBO_55_16]|nr:MAG: hypothetical protein A2Z45_06305 [Chloroflexi bacterium RBG_19FT_COMBO_55_16]
MKGAAYGVRSSSIDLNVLNGTVADMLDWLKIEDAEIKQPVRPQVKTPEIPDKKIKIPTKGLMKETIAQLEKIKQAGLAPVVQIPPAHG